MACNGCKKKSGTTEKVKTVNVSQSFQLRDGITFDQIGMDNPTDKNIIAFLKINPKRISLFKKYPFDWNNNKKEDNKD